MYTTNYHQGRSKQTHRSMNLSKCCEQMLLKRKVPKLKWQVSKQA